MEDVTDASGQPVATGKPWRIIRDDEGLLAAVPQADCEQVARLLSAVEETLLNVMQLIRHGETQDAVQAIQNTRVILGKWAGHAKDITVQMEQAAHKLG